MKKFTALAGVLLLSTSLVAGCTQGAAPGNRVNPNAPRVQDIGDRMGVRNIVPNTNPGTVTNYGTARANQLRQDRALEARVASIPGIKSARVLVVGNTAYVAINQGTNANARTGATSYGITTNRDRNANVNNAIGGTTGAGINGTMVPGSPYGPNGTATVRNSSIYGGAQGYGNYYNAGQNTYGTAGTTGNAGVAGNYGPTGAGTKYGGAAGATGPATNYGVAGGVAGNAGTTGLGTNYGVTGRTGVGAGGTTDGNAGITGNVGTYGTTTRDVTSDVKARVTAAVKQGNPAIQNVYVSANPAIMNRMNAFVTDTATGHPVRGVNDLLDTLRRMFPATR